MWRELDPSRVQIPLVYFPWHTPPQPLVLLLWSNLGLVWLLSDHSVWTFDRSTLEGLPTIFAQEKHSFVPLAHWRGAGRTAFTDEVSCPIICDTVLTDAFSPESDLCRIERVGTFFPWAKIVSPPKNWSRNPDTLCTMLVATRISSSWLQSLNAVVTKRSSPCPLNYPPELYYIV